MKEETCGKGQTHPVQQWKEEELSLTCLRLGVRPVISSFVGVSKLFEEGGN